MPKATLLAEPWKDYIVCFGWGSYTFEGGTPIDVPVSVALVLEKKTKRGESLFKIEDMPDIISPEKEASKQNVKKIFSGARQLDLISDQCLSSAA